MRSTSSSSQLPQTKQWGCQHCPWPALAAKTTMSPPLIWPPHWRKKTGGREGHDGVKKEGERTRRGRYLRYRRENKTQIQKCHDVFEVIRRKWGWLVIPYHKRPHWCWEGKDGRCLSPNCPSFVGCWRSSALVSPPHPKYCNNGPGEQFLILNKAAAKT